MHLFGTSLSRAHEDHPGVATDQTHSVEGTVNKDAQALIRSSGRKISVCTIFLSLKSTIFTFWDIGYNLELLSLESVGMSEEQE